jgi:hypothetical protein
MVWGEEEEILDGTQLAADWTFSGLQKFGQAYLDRLRGRKLPNRLLEKVRNVHYSTKYSFRTRHGEVAAGTANKQSSPDKLLREGISTLLQ